MCITNVFQKFGSLDAVIHCVNFVTAQAKDSSNVFHKSPAWRRGIVGDIRMLQRSEMYKLRSAVGLTMNSAFTDTQEAKQAML